MNLFYNLYSRLLLKSACFAIAEKARLHAEAKAAEAMKRKAEAEAVLLEKQKREVERDEARRALQRVLVVCPFALRVACGCVSL